MGEACLGWRGGGGEVLPYHFALRAQGHCETLVHPMLHQ